MASIRVSQVSKIYGRHVAALDQVTFSVERGVYGLLGPNGAGKTTLLGILSTLLEMSAGAAWVAGHDVRKERRAVRAAIGYLPQDFGLYAALEGRELLAYFAALKGLAPDPAWIRTLVQRVGLEADIRKRVGAMSGGMRQRLGIAQALLGRPSVLLVDEPTVGLDPEERTRFRNLLVELGATSTVLLSTHIVEDIEFMANHVIVLDQGQIRFDGAVVDLRNRALGQVWSARLQPDQVNTIKTHVKVTRLMPAGDGLTEVRWVGSELPNVSARSVPPTLEEGYLFTVRGDPR